MKPTPVIGRGAIDFGARLDGTVSLDSVDRWIRALHAIPATARTFDVTPRRAELEFGITSELADLLTERGLPHSLTGEVRFAWADLHYIALRLGSARIYLRTIRSWARSVADIAASGARTMSLRYRTYTDPGTTVDVLLPEGRRVNALIGPDQIAAKLNVRMASSATSLPSSLDRVLHEAAALDFYILPRTLSGDVSFARRTGLTDCATASRIVADECQRLGIEARMAFGLVVAPPLGTPHEWAEIRVREVWAPADPLLLRVLGRFAALDPSRWPCTYSPTAILLRLADRDMPIVAAPEGPVETSFVVTDGEQSSKTSQPHEDESAVRWFAHPGSAIGV